MSSREFLVGNTGLVGSNLAHQHKFSGLFHSSNITEAYGQKPDLLIYAGVHSKTFIANEYPEADKAITDGAKHNISEIAPKKLVLISTVNVYPDVIGVDEDFEIDENRLKPYGANRHSLEVWAENNISDCYIIRLPAIYGLNLKKNFLYDYIHFIPPMLTENKLLELSEHEPEILRFYVHLENEYFKCKTLSSEEKLALTGIFRKVNFSALNFTDSRSVYQFYALKNLWHHIEITLSEGLRRVNLVTPPISAGYVYKFLTGETFTNIIDKPAFNYDLRTKYADLFGGRDGYIMTRESELAEIKEFVDNETCRI